DVMHHDRAAADFAKALTIEPDFPYLRGGLIYSKLQCSDWSGLAQELDGLSAAVRAGKRATEPFALLCTPASAAEQLRAARIYVADKYPPSAEPLWHDQRYAHDRIRIGYMSGEFREQATAYLIAELLELHDRQRFEVFGVSTGSNDGSPMRS